MQTHPIWVHFIFGMKIVCFIDILMTFIDTDYLVAEIFKYDGYEQSFRSHFVHTNHENTSCASTMDVSLFSMPFGARRARKPTHGGFFCVWAPSAEHVKYVV